MVQHINKIFWLEKFRINRIETSKGLLAARSKVKVKEWLRGLSKKQRRKIRWVAIDMWDGYFNAVREVFSHAKIGIDRFHVQKALGKKIDKAR
jgi:transposase